MGDNTSGQSVLSGRSYGQGHLQLIVLHGGPGAPGYLAPLARRLGENFGVFEPFQRGSGAMPLTVARHVADLNNLISSRCHGRKPALVGHSWGAMLALAYAADHPDATSGLVLIGCGTFDLHSRQRLNEIREQRIDATFRRQLDALSRADGDPDEQLASLGMLYQQIDSYDLIDAGQRTDHCDKRAHEETWADMTRLQAEASYPQAFSAIRIPVLMLHGDYDPHPGPMIRDSLIRYMPQLQYVELKRCGHYPWLERAARNAFYATLLDWLSALPL